MAAALAVQEFVQAAASVMFVMNGRWKPFYKWMPRALRELPQPAPHLAQQLEALLCDGGLSLLDPHARETQVHICCSMLADALRLNGWTDTGGCDMQQIGLDIRNRITDPQLRALPVLLA